MTESLVKNNSNHAVVIVPAATKQEKIVQKKTNDGYVEPPDGGFRAYLVMISAFMCNGILFGIINTYSVIYISLQDSLEKSGDAAASGKACKCSLGQSNVRERVENFDGGYYLLSLQLIRINHRVLLLLRMFGFFVYERHNFNPPSIQGFPFNYIESRVEC